MIKTKSGLKDLIFLNCPVFHRLHKKMDFQEKVFIVFNKYKLTRIAKKTDLIRKILVLRKVLDLNSINILTQKMATLMIIQYNSKILN